MLIFFIFFPTGAEAKEVGTPWCHFGYLKNLAGPALAKRSSICRGSCSIWLLMSTVVGGTHVCHVMRLAGSTFTWRSDHRGGWQPLWQMFSPSWGESHQRPVQSEGLDVSLSTTAAACVCLGVHPAHCETPSQRFLQNDVKRETTGSLNVTKQGVES